VAKLTLLFKGNNLGTFPVKEGDLLIGRDPQCEIIIDSLAISPVHARITTVNGTSTVYDMNSKEGISVNHKRVNEQSLEFNDVITLGKHIIKYEEGDAEQPRKSPETGESPATSTPVPPAILQILAGEKLGKIIKLRSSMTDLAKMNIKPALISRRSDGYFISALVDGQKITVGDTIINDESCKLNDGDIITIDDMKLQFYLDN
jgi:hypothetical protein